MKREIIAAVAVATMASACCSNPQTPTQMAQSKIDSLFTERYAVMAEDGKATFPNPGGTVIIKKGDTVLFEKAYGIADIETKAPIDSNTFFNIASVTKQFTAVAILKLQAEGKIDIDKSIYDVAPGVNKYLPKAKKPFTDITVKQLMSHSSGIQDTRPRESREFCLTATDMESLEYMTGIKELSFTPGTEYEYINPTFQLLYIMIQELSGKPFEQYMREEIFTPAGMEQTLYFEKDRVIPNMSHGYMPTDEEATEANKVFKEFDYGEETFFATKADGGLYTSINEFVKWEKALAENKIISQELKELAYSEITKVSGSTYCDYQNRPYTSYGCGWFMESKPNMPKKVYHTGDNGGFQIYAAKFPHNGLTITVFENRHDHSRWQMVEKLDAIAAEAGWLE